MIKDINVYKKKLEEELLVVEKELSKIGVQDQKNPSNWVPKMPEENISSADENEVADTVDDVQINNAVVNDLEVRYNNIKVALNKIEEGIYGVCEINGEEISEERLNANPSARTCREHMDQDLK
ncbi:TraR/DksA C4-type zinc finger protein [Patescibacteria group bacterium]|nr:TraR/DksA C4-type zinc finger protein [Patescibacteria group bacterium]